MEELIKQYRIPLLLVFFSLCCFLVGIVGIVSNTSKQAFSIRSTNNQIESTESAVMVDVSGAVNSPNVYRLQTGSHVFEAIEMAGGLAEDADIENIEKTINKARLLKNGEKLYIPRKSEDPAVLTASDNQASKTININTASISELNTLPGVGEKTSEKIIAGRPYESIEELKTRKIVGESVYEKIAPLIRLY